MFFKKPPKGIEVDREEFIRQFALLSESLLKKNLKPKATESEHLRVACKLLCTKFIDALGVSYAKQ